MENNIEKSESQLPQDNKNAKEVIKEVKEELSSYRKPFEADWKQYDDAYYGKQHKTGENKKTVKNHIFKIIEGEVPILTDSMPGTQVTSHLEAKQEDADILNKAIKYVYQDQNLPLILPTLVRSSLTSAPGYLYVRYNQDADNGEGKIEFTQLPWTSVWLDGNAQTIEQAEKARIEIPMRRGAVARTWPEKSEEILKKQGKSASEAQGTDDNYESRDVSGNSESGSTGRPAKHRAKDLIDYVETWIKSYDLEPIPQEETQEEMQKERGQLSNSEAPDVGKWENHDAHIQDHSALRGEVLAQLNLPPDSPIEAVSQTIEALLQQNPEAQDLAAILLLVKMIDNHNEEHEELKKLNPQGQRPKYKDGWRVIKSVEDIILYDGPNPEGNGHIPLVPFYCYKDDTIYGFSEVKNIIDAQRSLNTMDWFEYEGLQVSTNPGWIFDTDAGIEGQLSNAPGIEIKKKRGTEVRRLEPGAVSPQLEQRKVGDETAMEDISGMNEATQGNIVTGAASGVAIQKLQTQAIGRIRLKDRYLQHYSIRRLGIITASLVINNWTSEKRFRLRSDNTNVEEVIFNPLSMQDLGYTVEVLAGSMAGIDKDALNAFYMQLYGQSQGGMTFEDLLMVIDIPKKELLLAKFKERQTQAQELEQLQAQLEELQTQNAQLKGLVNPNLVEGDEKKVFDMASKQALINQLLQQAQAAEQEAQMQTQGNAGAINGQSASQGNM